ncbi:MAG TPA: acyl-CoA desaturase [Acidimicrobiales bacterium]|nr:acyl-CoA desaturase [Acidimicrobiales bacterium]
MSRLQQVSAAILVVGPLVALGVAVASLWGRGISGLDVVIAVVMYVVTCLGVTVGFHRLLAHRSFRANRPLRIALAVTGTMAVEGSALTWVAQHRKHHAHTEREGDPHSPFRYGTGFWPQLKGLVYAHVGWFFDSHPSEPERWAPDLLADRDMLIVSKTSHVWSAASLAIPFLIGWAATATLSGGLLAFLWGGLVRMMVLHHVTWSTNSLCHMFGRRPFQTADHSSNFAPLAVLSLGESWHNAHHAFPSSARHGVDRGQLDATARVIRVLERLGWATHVRWPGPERLASRRRRPGAEAPDEGGYHPDAGDRVEELSCPSP